MRITGIHARQILDSRGNPTIEVDCTLADGTMGRASVPSGASTGTHEALELRDSDPGRFLGRGVLKAVEHVSTTIRGRLVGMAADDQRTVDQALIELDGTENKSRLGANAVLGVSLAVCRAAALSAGVPVLRRLSLDAEPSLPVPLLNVINGGVHAPNNLDVQEYMIVPAGFDTFNEALRAAAEVFQHLKNRLIIAGRSAAVGDEGGFAPDCVDNEEPLKLITEAIEAAGYAPGEQVFLALDVAASELHAQGSYALSGPPERHLNSDDLIDLYAQWLDEYPLISIEDGLAEEDWPGWQRLTAKLGPRLQLVGDDIFVTSMSRLTRGIDENVANAILIKPNQVGTVTETLDCIRLAHDRGYRTVVSHRSGETQDHFIADLACAANSGQIKTGAPCRGERVAKYNRLLRIEEFDRLPYAGLAALER